MTAPPAFWVPVVLPQVGGLQGGVVASDAQVASTQGSWLCPGPLSPEDVSFLCYMGTGQRKALSYACCYSSCWCQATAAVQSAAPGREGL